LLLLNNKHESNLGRKKRRLLVKTSKPYIEEFILMNDTITTLREQWEALRLELLVPARLTDEDFAAILKAREDSSRRVFVERLPIVVAQFKEAAQEEIMRYAKKQKNVVYHKTSGLFRTLEPDTFALDVAVRYGADIDKINMALFGLGVDPDWKARVEIGLYKKEKAPPIHSDAYLIRLPTKMCMVYASRLGDLPAWVIKGRDDLNASREVRQLIKKAEKGFWGRAARTELRERGVLVPTNLGDVILMRAGPIASLMEIRKIMEEGVSTRHCSSPVPKGGSYSAFLRQFACGA
jgi:hypothetical protein